VYIYVSCYRYRTCSGSTARRLAVDLAYQNMYILYVRIEYIYSIPTARHIISTYRIYIFYIYSTHIFIYIYIYIYVYIHVDIEYIYSICRDIHIYICLAVNIEYMYSICGYRTYILRLANRHSLCHAKHILCVLLHTTHGGHWTQISTTAKISTSFHGSP